MSQLDNVKPDFTDSEWTDEEDEKLRSSVILCKQKNWRIISESIGTKSPRECQQRWKTQINPDILRVKGRWTRDEDAKLIELVNKYGTKNWRFIASHLNGRLPKQCRERWCNQLDPSIKKDSLSQEEWKVVKEAHEKFGNRWSEIAKLLPGRTANHVKNQWNTMLRRQLFDVSLNSDDESDYDISYSPGRKKRSSRSDESHLYNFKKRKKNDESEDVDICSDDSHSSIDSNETVSIHSPSTSERSNPLYSPFFEALVETSCLILQKQNEKKYMISKQKSPYDKNYGIKTVNLLPSINHLTSFNAHGKMNHASLLYNF